MTWEQYEQIKKTIINHRASKTNRIVAAIQLINAFEAYELELKNVDKGKHQE